MRLIRFETSLLILLLMFLFHFHHRPSVQEEFVCRFVVLSWQHNFAYRLRIEEVYSKKKRLFQFGFISRSHIKLELKKHQMSRALRVSLPSTGSWRIFETYSNKWKSVLWKEMLIVWEILFFFFSFLGLFNCFLKGNSMLRKQQPLRFVQNPICFWRSFEPDNRWSFWCFVRVCGPSSRINSI